MTGMIYTIITNTFLPAGLILAGIGIITCVGGICYTFAEEQQKP